MRLVAPSLALTCLWACAEDPAPTPPPPSPDCTGATPWVSAPNLPAGPTQETAVVALAGKLYVLGGFSGRLGILPSVQVFDIASCTWTTGPELPGPSHHINAAAHGDTLYIAGVLSDAEFSPSAVTWALTPGRDLTWRTLPAMPAASARGSSAMGALGDQLVVAGGLAGSAVATVSAFDLPTQTWSELPPLPSPIDHGCGAVVGGKLYVIGGRRGTLTSVTASVHEYTPGAGWRARTAMPTARGGVACGVVGERIIVVGGEGNRDNAAGLFANVEAYSPASDTWEILPAMPTPRHGMGAAGADGKLYVPGGGRREGFAATDVFEIFTP